MHIAEQVEAYLASQPEPKRTDLRELHAYLLAQFPDCRLWFNGGTNQDGKVVANPNIGYGAYDVTYLARTYGHSIGKATVTGYCIKFRRLSLINVDTLHAAIRHGMAVDHGD